MEEINYVNDMSAAPPAPEERSSPGRKGAAKWIWQGKMPDAFWKAATLFSFVVNLVLVIVLLTVVGLVFEIKNSIAQPLVGGLYGSFVQMDNARIATTITVSDSIQVNDDLPVVFDLPLNQDTVVTTTAPVLITGATVNIQGGVLTLSNAPTTILLPAGTALPVTLNLVVPVNQVVPVVLDVPVILQVPVDIPLNRTELHTPFFRLRTLFQPYSDALDKLPPTWNEFICQNAEAFCGLAPN